MCDFRPLSASDEPIIWQILRHSAHEPSVEAVRRQPLLARYAAGWGRAGDGGWVAVSGGVAVGAAWLRLWPGDDKGFGFLDDHTPELAFAVVPERRGEGIGTRLLELLFAASAPHYAAISLNVRAENPAVRLYERSGFVRVVGSEIINRTGGVSFNMVKALQCEGASIIAALIRAF